LRGCERVEEEEEGTAHADLNNGHVEVVDIVALGIVALGIVALGIVALGIVALGIVGLGIVVVEWGRIPKQTRDLSKYCEESEEDKVHNNSCSFEEELHIHSCSVEEGHIHSRSFGFAKRQPLLSMLVIPFLLDVAGSGFSASLGRLFRSG
jgi:hypothetical protein